MSTSQTPIIPIMAPAKRKKYDANFKLKVINFAKENNNCAAARQYGVTEKMVRDWKSNEKALKSMPRGKCALRRGTPHWPELEKHVADMVAQHRQNGYVVTRNTIRLFALQWAKSNLILFYLLFGVWKVCGRGGSLIRRVYNKLCILSGNVRGSSYTPSRLIRRQIR